MLQLDLPTINVLTKIDKVADRDPLPFNLDFYTEVQDLDYLLPHLEAEQRGIKVNSDPNQKEEETEEEEDPPPSRFQALNQAITSLLSDFALLAFEPLFVEDKHTMSSLLHTIDRASGYAFSSGTEGANESVWTVAVRQDDVRLDIADVQERWIDRRREMDEAETERWKEEGEAQRAKGLGEESEGDGDMMDGLQGPGPMDVGGIKVVRVNKKN